MDMKLLPKKIIEFICVRLSVLFVEIFVNL